MARRTGTLQLATSLAVVASSLVGHAQAFYLPGSAPTDYASGDRVDVHVNALSPMLTDQDVRSLISHDYYDPRLHFCQPHGGPKKQPESLGSILWGDRIYNSPFQVEMLRNTTCQTLCESTVPAEHAKFVNQLITDNYGVNLMIDGLPGAEVRADAKTGERYYDPGGFPLGDTSSGSPVINNHYDIYLQWHRSTKNTHRVVGALVYPRSSASTDGKAQCYNEAPQRLSETSSTSFFYTYSIQWTESDVPYATRFDQYLHVFDTKVHWFGLVNSLVALFFLVSMVATILARSVNAEIARYQAIEDLENDQMAISDDTGFKLLHGDVFRPPRRRELLCAMVGNGAQIAFMLLVTLVFAVLGFLSPANRGMLATVLLITWTFFSGIGGYVCARMYGSMGGEDWRKAMAVVSLAFPALLFGSVFLLNLCLWAVSASGAMPFGTMLAILALYMLFSLPLSIAGYYLGMRHGPISVPVKTAVIPRQVPPQPTYLNFWPSSLLGGILPFGAAFVEGFFIFSSFWAHRAYIAFGFGFLVYIITLLTTATVTITLVYLSLGSENHRWQWRAFAIGAGSSAYIFAYGVWFWISRSAFDGFTSTIVYFGYLLVLCGINALLMGSIGFLAAFFAVRIMYSKIRVD